MARKRKSKPTSKSRSRKQTVRDRYAHAREDAQLAGLIPTTPEEALKSERVDPSSQDSQRFPGLDRLAILNSGDGEGGGWSVPEHVKRKVIEQNSEVLFERRTTLKTAVVDGREVTVEVELPPDRQAQRESSKILMLADRMETGQLDDSKRGTVVNVNNQIAIGALEKLREEILIEDAKEATGADSLPPVDSRSADSRGT